MNQNEIFHNINNEYNDFFKEEEINKNGRYPNLKAYIKSYLDSQEKQYDPDVSDYSMEMYKSKWKFLNDGKIETQGKNYKNYKYNINNLKKEINLGEMEYLVFGDTLNSMKHIFTHFITEFCKNISDVKYKDEVWNNSKYKKILSYFDSIFSDDNLDCVQWSRLILDQFEIFASLSDTIGNQFPCLPKFNCERSNLGKHDFCDLLLDAVYRYLKNSEDAGILKFLFNGVTDQNNENGYSYKKEEHVEDSIIRTQYWLSNYFDNNWENFVEENCFQYFVKYNYDEKRYGEPIKLWKNHSFDNLSYPRINETLYEMLKFINQGITIRNYLIITK